MGSEVPIGYGEATKGGRMKGAREKCLAAGMHGYLLKPIRPLGLDELVESYLAQRAETRKAEESTLSKK